MTEYYIAWNKDKTEGYITTDKSDAQSARTGKKRRDPTRGYVYIATVAQAFHEAYEDETFPPVQKVDI